MLLTCDILGVILAGGAGRRMFAGGDGDKCLIDLAGRPVLAYVIDRFSPQVSQLILNANGDAVRFARFGLEVVADGDGSRAGPLAGFKAAMAFAETCDPRPQAILTATADAPFLPLDLATRLAAAMRDDRPAIAVSNGQRHPATGLWPLNLHLSVDEALNEGRRRVESFAQHHDAIEVDFPFGDIGGRKVDPFFNANTPDDITEARAILAGQNRGSP